MQQNWQQGQYGGYGQQQQPPQQQQQQTGGGAGFLGPQPTGFGGMGSMGPQPTGYGMGMGMGMSGMGGMGGMGQQPTGFGQQQQRRPPSISPLPTGQPQQQSQQGGGYSFLNTQPTGFRPSFTGSSGAGGMGMNPQMTGFAGGGASGLMSQPTGFQGGSGLMSQPTGMGMMSQPTGMGGLRAQPTGVHDPRLQTMMQSFMPSNISQPFNNSGVAQFNQTPQQPLQQQFQSLLQNPSVKTPKVPWVLTKQEKKDYDQIFRAWDTDGDGFITGETAREVFGQSGLDQDGLMKIWTLSDVDNRGKLNLPEFHVAMGLIYRALNGNDIPDRLPEELIPASMRDIDTTVSFMRDLLKHESNTRSNTSSPAYGGASTPVGGASKDATAYKHDDSRPSGYKPSSRHLDRKSVRYAGEESSADISDIRRQLANTSAMLDKSNDEYNRKTEEDEQLEADVDDLKYRVKRIQDDIEYLTKGRRSADKDEERRKLEREMLFLMHEKLPELERRQRQREDEKRMEERAGTRARDRRNDTHGRYRDDREKDDDRDWLKGSYDRDRGGGDKYRRDSRDRDRSRDRYDDRSRDRSRDRYERPRSPPRSRTPPPAPPPAPPANAVAPPPPAPPAPTSNATAAPSTKNMTPEERSAFIREQAQRRIQERLKALGVDSGPSPSDPPAVDKSVEERLEREKREAEEKSKSAEREQEAREEARRQRLQGGAPAPKTDDDASASTGSPLKSALKKGPAAPPAPPASRAKPPPPAPKSRQPAPPSPAAPPKQATPAPPPQEEEDPEEAELRRKEEARQKAKEDRKARLAALEAEEEEERRQEEARLAARQARSTPAASPAPPPAPPAPPAPAPSSAAQSPKPAGGDHNPFRKPGNPASGSAAGSAGGGFNPFFKPQAAAGAASPARSASPAPGAGATSPPPPPPPPPPAPFAAPAPAPTTTRAPAAAAADDEWERIEEKTDDSDADSSDDDYANSRTKRAGLASALFGNLTGGAAARSGSSTPTAPPAPRAAPPAALAKLGGGAPSSGGGMSALLSSIQGGARLKKAQTVDKSVPPVSGRVIGGADVPDHINTAEPPAANGRGGDDYEEEDDVPQRNPNRQSVDWLGGLAADHSRGSGSQEYTPLEATKEVEEPAPAQNGGYDTPSINVQSADTADELDEFDLTKTIRVRTLFPYDGQRDVDLSFIENVVIEAHPAKDPQSPWWYGTLVKEGKKGWFPHTYVDELKPVQAKASFTYDGGSEEELPFVEGDVLTIVDTSDEDWWKTEKAGVIFIVPASYFELLGKVPTPPAQNEVRAVVSGAGSSSSDVAHRNTNTTPSSSQHQPHSDDDHTPRLGAQRPASGVSLSPLSPTSRPIGTGREARPRSSTVNSYASDDGDGYESSSSGDSMLSYWSADGGSESDTDTSAPSLSVSTSSKPTRSTALPTSISTSDPKKVKKGDTSQSEKVEKEAERKRREEERSKVLELAGLKIRREPPGVPGQTTRKGTRRRPAPAPGNGKGRRRRAAPGVPKSSITSPTQASGSSSTTPAPVRVYDDDPQEPEKEAGSAASVGVDTGTEEPEKMDTLDAYARYENYLAQAQTRQTRSRSESHPTPRSNTPSSVPLSGAASSPLATQQSNGSQSQLAINRQARSASVTQPHQHQHQAGGGRFSGLISRIMAPTSSSGSPGQEPRKSISIVRVDDPSSSPGEGGDDGGGGGGAAMSDTADVGRTWTSLVESSVLGTMSDKERKRQEAIFEFIATEGSYNRDLQIIVEAFYATMLDLIDEKALTVIFANIEDILLTATSFLSSLEQRQKSCRLYIDVVGDILEEHIPMMRVYMAYCVNQQQAIKLLQSQRESNPALAAHLQSIRETNPSVRGLDLSSFLLIPMQRITRYPLLLRQILQYTSPDQDFSAVQNALNEAENITAAINESIRDAEGDERLRLLSEDLWIGGEGRLDLTAPTAYQGVRKLLKEGPVLKAKSGRKLTMILCNDILVLIESKNLYRMPIPLHEVQAREGKEEAFQLKVEYHRGGDTVGLKASNAREAKEWVSLINKHRSMTLDARNEVDRSRHHGFTF